MTKTEWIRKIPDINGLYWVYGKIWGDESPEFHIIKVMKVSNGVLWEYRGSFLFPSDIKGEIYVTELFPPELPV